MNNSLRYFFSKRSSRLGFMQYVEEKTFVRRPEKAERVIGGAMQCNRRRASLILDLLRRDAR